MAKAKTTYVCRADWQYGQAEGQRMAAGDEVGTIETAEKFPGNPQTLADGVRNGRFIPKPKEEAEEETEEEPKE
jgi:hypothetical protein